VIATDVVYALASIKFVMTSYVSSCISSHVALSAAYIIPLQTAPYSVYILLTYCTGRLTTTTYLHNTLLYNQSANQSS
jgi:hypothetical protein